MLPFDLAALCACNNVWLVYSDSQLVAAEDATIHLWLILFLVCCVPFRLVDIYTDENLSLGKEQADRSVYAGKNVKTCTFFSCLFIKFWFRLFTDVKSMLHWEHDDNNVYRHRLVVSFPGLVLWDIANNWLPLCHQCCFSEKVHIEMRWWSHYGNSHGVVLKAILETQQLRDISRHRITQTRMGRK